MATLVGAGKIGAEFFQFYLKRAEKGGELVCGLI
jgi:hypothetical protein